jgi:hypothetical protein
LALVDALVRDMYTAIAVSGVSRFSSSPNRVLDRIDLDTPKDGMKIRADSCLE